ncbi:MAG: hypothetical protein BWZ10_00725 [candidate division BRC1 bacterium ADurb.BinA364]|nr:MAG: hypothetical protein BWZ10_00725 [candidate division BRC1 bacterium ADurb.BinA364]
MLLDPIPSSLNRHLAHRIGAALTAIGALLFLSAFGSGILHFGNFDNFEARGRNMAAYAFGGIAAMWIGGFLSRLGRMNSIASDSHARFEGRRTMAYRPRRSAAGVARAGTSARCDYCGAPAPSGARICKQCGAPQSS